MSPEGKECCYQGDAKIDFCLYCEPDEIHTQIEHHIDWKKATDQIPRGQKVEVQYETRFDLEYWKYLPKILKGKADGVHAPTKERDIASSDEIQRNWSIEETMGSMDLADALEAKYFVVHLTPQDDFQDREGQLERGFGSVAELARYYKKKGFDFKFLPEILEYPKWPADTEESVMIMKKSKDIFNNFGISNKLGFCLDTGHLWHNLNSLLPKRKSSDFRFELENYISEVSRVVPIDVVHLVGAYVENDGNNGGHVTHAYPGLLQGQNYAQAETEFGRKPQVFNGEWMDLDTVLCSINKIRSGWGGRPIITIEAHDPNIDNQVSACQKIQDRLKAVKI